MSTKTTIQPDEMLAFSGNISTRNPQPAETSNPSLLKLARADEKSIKLSKNNSDLLDDEQDQAFSYYQAKLESAYQEKVPEQATDYESIDLSISEQFELKDGNEGDNILIYVSPDYAAGIVNAGYMTHPYPYSVDGQLEKIFFYGSSRDDFSGISNSISENLNVHTPDLLNDGTLTRFVIEDNLPDSQPQSILGNLSVLLNTNDGGQTFTFIDTPQAINYLDTLSLTHHGIGLIFTINDDTLTASAQGSTVFNLTINPDGEYIFNLEQGIDHSGADNDSEITGLAFGHLITVIDADGNDAILGNAFIINIENDIPLVDNSAILGLSPFILDESNLAADASSDISLLFANALSYGRDGSGSIQYSIVLAENGISSGLYTTDGNDTSNSDGDSFYQGNEILLHYSDTDANIIEGRDGNTVYFTISLDTDTNSLTFDQRLSIWHDQFPGEHNENLSLSTINANDLTIVATITDADNDTAQASVSLGHNVFTISDDGPSINIEPAVNDASPNTDSISEDGTSISGIINIVPGADDVNMVEINIDADGDGNIETYNLDTSPSLPIFNAGGDQLGVLTVIANGNHYIWTFEPAIDIDHNDAFTDNFQCQSKAKN